MSDRAELGGVSGTPKRLWWIFASVCFVLAWVLPLWLGEAPLVDDLELYRSRAIRHFDISAMFSRGLWADRGASAVYRPITALSLALDVHVLGSLAKSVHLLLHAACVFAVALLLERMLGVSALFAAIVLYLHPVAAEQAWWVSARSASLCWLFGALALHVVVPLQSSRSAADSWGRALLAALLVLLAALAREDGVLFAVVGLALAPRGGRWRLAAAFGAALGAYHALRNSAVPTLPGFTDDWIAPLRGFAEQLRMLFLLESPRLIGTPQASARGSRLRRSP